MEITFRYGVGNSLTNQVPNGWTIGHAKNDPVIRAALGFGANVKGHVCGIAQTDCTPLAPGMIVTFADAPQEKGRM